MVGGSPFAWRTHMHSAWHTPRRPSPRGTSPRATIDPFVQHDPAVLTGSSGHRVRLDDATNMPLAPHATAATQLVPLELRMRDILARDDGIIVPRSAIFSNGGNVRAGAASWRTVRLCGQVFFCHLPSEHCFVPQLTIFLLILSRFHESNSRHALGLASSVVW